MWDNPCKFTKVFTIYTFWMTESKTLKSIMYI